jgi:transposase-like protein
MKPDPFQPRMSPHYHGVSYAEAAGMFGVSEATVRSWFARHPEFAALRTRDGRIDPNLLNEWYENHRDAHQAGRRGNKGTPKERDLPRMPQQHVS